MSVQALLLTSNQSTNIVVDAAYFDGINDYMTRGADLTGIVNSNTGIVSFWYRIDGFDTLQRYIMESNILRFNIAHGTDNKIRIFCKNAADVIILETTTSAYVAGATWLHILSSWDLSTGALSLYVNDVSNLTTITNTNDTIAYAGATNWGLGAVVGTGSGKIFGSLAEFYFAPNQYLDFSNIYNRRKFISSTGKPVFLGSSGALPTGTSPIIYNHINKAEAAANFALNRGTGGNFTITGILDTASTSPSD